MRDKVVITAALSGAAPTKAANPAVPHTTEEYVREAKRAEEAGAAVVHVHFRDPNTGAPTTDPAIMQEVVQGIRENTNLLLNLSTGVYPEAPLAMRRRPIELHTPDIASLNPGTMNFCLVSHRDGQIIYDFTFANPFSASLEFGKIMTERGIKPELECFDIGHVHNVIFLQKHHHFIPTPMHFCLIFGVMGGVPFNSDTVNSYLHALPPGSTWVGLGVGPFSFPVAMMSASFGGHVRVGLEDSLFVDYAHKVLAKSNGELVERAVAIVKLAGREAATVAEARELLSLPSRGA
jgi:3-keto-5-aminohexanoate cleavage enzyme